MCAPGGAWGQAGGALGSWGHGCIKKCEKCVTVRKNRPLVTYKVEKLVQSVELYAKLKKSECFAGTPAPEGPRNAGESITFFENVDEMQAGAPLLS